MYHNNLGSPSLREDDEDDECFMPYSDNGSALQSPTTKESNINPLDVAQYLFSVKDTGIGIPKEKANKLFKTFSQVDASTTRNFGGTGKNKQGILIKKKY